MADCVFLPQCVFFHDRMADMPATAEIMKKRYCRADSSQCARWMVRSKLGPASVPTDLFPNQLERAAHVIAGGK